MVTNKTAYGRLQDPLRDVMDTQTGVMYTSIQSRETGRNITRRIKENPQVHQNVLKERRKITVHLVYLLTESSIANLNINDNPVLRQRILKRTVDHGNTGKTVLHQNQLKKVRDLGNRIESQRLPLESQKAEMIFQLHQ